MDALLAHHFFHGFPRVFFGRWETPPSIPWPPGWRGFWKSPMIEIASSGQMGYFGLSPLPVRVTTRIITFLVGNPSKPSFATVTGWGVDPRDTVCKVPHNVWQDHFANSPGGFSIAILFCWSVAWWILHGSCLFDNNHHFFQCEEHSKELVGWLLYGIVLHFAVQSIALFWTSMEQPL